MVSTHGPVQAVTSVPGSQPRAIRSNWIDAFLEYTRVRRTPDLFRLWAAIVGVGGALERRVYLDNDSGRICPNLYVLLVAPPGVGKSQAIDPIRTLWRATAEQESMSQGSIPLHVSSEDVTRAGFMEELYEVPQRHGGQDVRGNDLLYQSLLVASDEFSTMLSSMDPGFMAFLTKMWDNPELFKERKRSVSKKDPLSNPQVSILAGVQPATLQQAISEVAWNQGMMARFILVYSEAAPPKGKLTAPTQGKESRERSMLGLNLQHDMNQLTNFSGRMVFSPDAEELADKILADGIAPAPTHIRLANYNLRRDLLFLKLCIISSASRNSSQVIEVVDVERVRNWMLLTEQHMPDVFRALTGNSDQAVIEELHLFAIQVFNLVQKRGEKFIKKEHLHLFLQSKVPIERVDRLLSGACHSGYLAPVGDPVIVGYVPKNKPLI